MLETSFLEIITPIRLQQMKHYLENNIIDFDKSNPAQLNASQYYNTIFEQFNIYCSLNKKDGILVKYIKPKHKWGRVHPNKSLGLTSFSKPIRNALIQGLYYDFDLKNAQPEIIRNICIANNIKYDAINEYCEKRTEIFISLSNKYKVSTNKIKKLFLRLCFFGTFEGWKNDNNLDENFKPTKFINAFINNLKDIAATIKEYNPQLYKTCYDMKNEKNETNYEGSMFALYVQEYELRIVEKVIKYLIENSKLTNYNNKIALTYEYDGIKLLKQNVDNYGGTEKVLELLNNIIYDVTGFKLKWDEKIIESNINLDEIIIDEYKTFEEVAAEFEKTHCKIINKSIFIKQLEDENITMTISKLKVSYDHLVYYDYNEKENLQKFNFIKTWLYNNPKQKFYDDVGIYPNPSKCPNNIYNMWRPFAMEKIINYENKQDELNIILNHIKILCDHNELVYDYFIKWIAQMIQYPDVKTICPTLISNQGAGKGTLLKLFEKMLGGNKYFETTNPMRDVWGDFNGRMANAFLVNLNELSKKDTIDCDSKIKGLITDQRLTINSKGIEQYDIKSFHRFIITTNNLEPINTSYDDRRNLIVRSSDELIGNKEYFNKLHLILDDENVIKTCYEFFKSIPNMDKFNELSIPHTEHHDNLKSLSLSPIENWLKDFAYNNSNKDNKNIELFGIDTLNLFKNWCCDNNVKYDIDAKKLGVRITNLKIMGIDKGRHTNKGDSRIYNIEKLKSHFGIGCVVQC